LRYGFAHGLGDPNKLDTNDAQGRGPDGIACNTKFEAPEWADSMYWPEPLDRTPVPTPVR
jgi:hypothetical protein